MESKPEFTKVLYNPILHTFAKWNGNAWEDNNVNGAYFYGLEKAANCGYKPIDSSREAALVWFHSLLYTERQEVCDGNTEILDGEKRKYESLTGREIELIWKKETASKLNPDNQLIETISELKQVYTKDSIQLIKAFEDFACAAYNEHGTTDMSFRARVEKMSKKWVSENL